MALKQDYGCDLCEEAILEISKLPNKLNNLGKGRKCECKMEDDKVDCRTSGKPVILQVRRSFCTVSQLGTITSHKVSSISVEFPAKVWFSRRKFFFINIVPSQLAN